jgi:Ca-activated chloride channel family protein
MANQTTLFGLTPRQHSGPAPVLCAAQVEGRLDGTLFELTLRQTYRNASDRLLEVVYTFPLPSQAVLLGFASELNGQGMQGQIVARRDAETRYEQALGEGHAPVLLEALGGGLHTANIGNLKPGEIIVLEVRFAQLLRFEQGRLRLAVPMTVAPRYGQPAAAGLQPQQVPQPSLGAEHPLTLGLTVAGELAQATVACPTHALRQTRQDQALRLELDRSAWLDRDVVILLTPAEAQPSLALLADDPAEPQAPLVLVAALTPLPTAARERVQVKLLVDCSGSMGGDSIASARRALSGVADGLRLQDSVSLSRFGTSFEHVLAPARCSPATLHQLRGLAQTLNADMGGTEMEAALRNTFALTSPTLDDEPADVLLITDGEIWQTERAIAAAQASEHRVFVIGVGSSPAEPVLRGLAEATGGACEFATPGEALEAAARRMLTRMRQQAWREVQIDWGGAPVWQSPLPRAVFDGDTVIAMAGLAGRAAAPASRRLQLTALDPQGRRIALAHAEPARVDAGHTLVRLAGAARLAQASPEEALALALRYQLLTAQTRCVLVHQRAAADRAQGEADLHTLPSMLAAGWGGTGSVVEGELDAMFVNDGTAGPPYAAGACALDFDAAAGAPASMVAAPSPMAASAPVERAAFLTRRSAAMPASPTAPQVHAAGATMGSPGRARRLFSRHHVPVPATLAELADAVADHFARQQPLSTLSSAMAARQPPDEVSAALQQLQALGLDADSAWLVLAHWHATQGGHTAQLALLRGPLRIVAPALLAAARAALDGRLAALLLLRPGPAAAVSAPPAAR